MEPTTKDGDPKRRLARTKIVATLGPKSWDAATIAGMIEAGASAFRFNFSHVTKPEQYQGIAAAIQRVREASVHAGRAIAVLQDLGGPKIRTGSLQGNVPVTLKVGEHVKITHKEPESRDGVISTTYEKLVHDVKVGDRILLDDGHLELVCVDSTWDSLVCRVISGGQLWSNKGINLPGVTVSAPAFTEKDRHDLDFGLEQNIDFVALSFVRSATDVRSLRDYIRSRGKEVAIVAKIEKQEAVDDLENILDAAEGIMVARGDLGVEVPSERLPVLQKTIISKARERGRVVITATQMLESMTQNPRPTRAETSDVANAIFDGTDAVMLSGETANGAYPVQTVATMHAIADYTESSSLYEREMSQLPPDHGGDIADATVHAACTAARDLGAAAIMSFTSSGRTCFKISFSRPKTRMIGATFTERAYNRLALCWGMESLLMPEARSVDELYFLAEKCLLENHLAKPRDLVVLVTGSNIGSGGTNTIKIHKVGKPDIIANSELVQKFYELYRRLGYDPERM